MSSSADDLRGSASEPGAAVAPGTPSPLDRLPGEDVPGDAAIAGDASTDPSVAPPGTPSWFDASAFAKPSFDAAAYVDDMSAYVSMDALREELESYQRHLRRLLVDAVNEDYDVFLSLGEGLVDVRKVVEDDMEGPIAAFKRDVTDTRAEIVALLNDLREKLRRRAKCAERRATLELMLDANNVASKVERLLDQLDSGDEENEASDDEAKEKDDGGGAGWTWKGPDEKEAKEKDDDDTSDVDSDDDASDAAFESEIAAAAAAEVFSVAETSVAGLDALRPGVAADGPSAAALALADDVADDADASSTPASGSASAKTSRASDLRERCRLLERVAGEANRSRFFQKIGDEKNLAFVKGLRSRVEKSEERLADAVAKATSLACAARDAVSVARCLSAYVALGRVSEAERAIREARVAPAVAEALRTSNVATVSATETESGGASNGASTDATAASHFGALLKKCVAAALRSVDVELAVTCPDWGLGKDEASSGVTTSAANLDARVCVLGASVLAEIDDQISSLAPSAYTPGAPETFFENHLAACAAIDVLEKNLPPTKAALALFRDSEPVRVFFKRWNVAAYFALRRREIVARLEADLEEDRLTRAVGAPGSAGAAFATAAAAGTYEALEKCFDTERVFLPRATDKFVKLAAQILARFGGWVAAGAKAERPSRSSPEDIRSAGDESGDVSSDSVSAEPPPVASWGATTSDEDLLQLREDVMVLVARVENELAPRVAGALRRTLGDAAAAAATQVLACGAAALVDSDADAADASVSSADASERFINMSATQLLDARLVSDVVKRCAAALGQLKGVTATFRMTNKPMPTKPSHFFSGVLDPLRRFAEKKSDATARASEKTKRALLDAAVAGVCAAYAAAAAELTVSVRKTEASLNRLKDRKQTREPSSGGVANGDGSEATVSDGPTDAQKICRQVRLDAEAFGRAVAKLGFDVEKSDAFGKLWEVCGEGEKFVA